jgi:phosphomannomutase/phosphoglucomutase
MKINPRIFRGFSIRGIVGEDFDLPGMETIARALGTWFRQQHAHTLVIGYDARISSPELHASLCEGLLLSGLNLIDIGLVPTPVINFATDFYCASGAVMITASHNPPEFNGLKIRSQRTVYGNDLQSIYEIAIGKKFIEGQGSCTKKDPLEAYWTALSGRVSIARPLRTVVDGANGANGKVVPEILRHMGCEVMELFCDLNGDFPNRDPDPTAAGATEDLANMVVEKKADLGLAFDGDGDRVIAVDEKGKTIMGDQMLMLLAGNALKRKCATKIVYEVLCSQAVPDYVTANGGQALAAPSGYAFVHNVMLASGAQIGGEMSGHFFMLDDAFKFDDAILASATLLALLAGQAKSFSELIASLPHYFSSREYRVPCPDEVKTGVVDSLRKEYAASGYSMEELDGIRIHFTDAWALIRQSNTQPVLSLRFESRVSAEQMQKVKKNVFAKLEQEYRLRELAWDGISDV